MKSFIASHRAGLGIAACVALMLVPLTPEKSGAPWGDVALAFFDVFMWGLVMLGGYALYTSPYLGILYREAPLRRASTGFTGLDERERALRDRATGLTYYLFATVSLALVLGASLAVKLGWLELDAAILFHAAAPYGFFALALPVLMIEWFEPSSSYLRPELDEEE